MIRKHDYQYVSFSLGEAQFVGKSMYESLGDMIRHLDANEVPAYDINKVVMRSDILGVYQLVMQNHVIVSSEMSRMVRALQDHIIGHYGSVDEYLSSHDIKVTRHFARLSEVVGYPISEENIE